MAQEESIRQELMKHFKYPEDKVRVQREKRIFAEVAYGHFFKVLEFAIQELHFVILCALTGLDEGEHLSFIYHLAQEKGLVLSLKISVPKNNPVIQSVTSYFPAAMIYEREVMDLLGVKEENIPEGPRYPLPDDWPTDQFPLRKDWSPHSGAPKEKHHA